jgi:hypothetical protein
MYGNTFNASTSIVGVSTSISNVNLYYWFITNPIVVINYELLCDVEIMMGLIFVLPLLNVTQNLDKFVQNKDYLICGFIIAMMLV